MMPPVRYLLWRELRFRLIFVAFILLVFTLEAIYASYHFHRLSDLRLWLLIDSSYFTDPESWLPSVLSSLSKPPMNMQVDLFLPLIPVYHGIPLVILSLLLGVHPYGTRGASSEFLSSRPGLAIVLFRYRFWLGLMTSLFLWLYPTFLFWFLFPHSKLLSIAVNASESGKYLVYESLFNFPVVMLIFAIWGMLAYFCAFYLFQNVDRLGQALAAMASVPAFALLFYLTRYSMVGYFEYYSDQPLILFGRKCMEYLANFWPLLVAFGWLILLLMFSSKPLSFRKMQGWRR